ncbi:hypothetical protein V8C86DRAFT_1213378 [Haematococcus lacustris]
MPKHQSWEALTLDLARGKAATLLAALAWPTALAFAPFWLASPLLDGLNLSRLQPVSCALPVHARAGGVLGRVSGRVAARRRPKVRQLARSIRWSLLNHCRLTIELAVPLVSCVGGTDAPDHILVHC